MEREEEGFGEGKGGEAERGEMEKGERAGGGSKYEIEAGRGEENDNSAS